MFAWIGRSVLGLVLLAQAPVEVDLDQDYMRTLRSGSVQAGITLIALHKDGSPARGFIQCAGTWFKHEDVEDNIVSGEELPFRMDSRGAVVMNPHVDDEQIHCWAEDKGMLGSVSIHFSADDPIHVRRFTLSQEMK